MPDEVALTYLQRGQRGIFSEVYFPRRIVAQGTIFGALEKGVHELVVKTYLKGWSKVLVQELSEHRHLFDPTWYDVPESQRKEFTKEDMEARIQSYTSPFFGWSNYNVDGVFWSKEEQELIEESTQIVRLIFGFESIYDKEAKDARCDDVLRAMLFWIITRQARLSHVPRWHREELKKFMRDYGPFTKQKGAFTKKYFEPVAREIFKWRGDWFLFVFGYLVRQFAQELAQRKKEEEEIWVASFFNLTVSVVVKASQ